MAGWYIRSGGRVRLTVWGCAIVWLLVLRSVNVLAYRVMDRMLERQPSPAASGPSPA